MDIVRRRLRFLYEPGDADDQQESMRDRQEHWERRVAKKYWDRLFKEYALADLSRHLQRKVGFRWRTDQEVVDGKGQFVCGSLSCGRADGLQSWEVNFAYREACERRNALVKVRLCDDCSALLNAIQPQRRARTQGELLPSRHSGDGSSRRRSDRSRSPAPVPASPTQEPVTKDTPQLLQQEDTLFREAEDGEPSRHKQHAGSGTKVEQADTRKHRAQQHWSDSARSIEAQTTDPMHYDFDSFFRGLFD